MLHFKFNFDGTWEAESAVKDSNGVPLVWRIEVCDDGTFDVSESDDELTARDTTFGMFDEAEEFCRGEERTILAEASAI